ncbi:MAG: hypothetical protein ACYTG0_26850 [Planctomycetota bacterium]|jgi:hypothetical protein
MEDLPERLVSRLQKLGLSCDEVALDCLSSQTAALMCFPMYMVANVHAWTSATQFQVPVVDLPGSEAIRESFVIGTQEGRLDISKEHRRVVSSLLTHAKPSDRVIYEYALETIALFLSAADPTVVAQTRTAVARMIIAVAKASGQGLLGTGEKISPQERACIEQIAAELHLRDTQDAAQVLQEIEDNKGKA